MIRVVVHLLADHLDETWCVRVTSGQEAEGNCRHLAVAPSLVQVEPRVMLTFRSPRRQPFSCHTSCQSRPGRRLSSAGRSSLLPSRRSRVRSLSTMTEVFWRLTQNLQQKSKNWRRCDLIFKTKRQIDAEYRPNFHKSFFRQLTKN